MTSGSFGIQIQAFSELILFLDPQSFLNWVLEINILLLILAIFHSDVKYLQLQQKQQKIPTGVNGMLGHSARNNKHYPWKKIQYVLLQPILEPKGKHKCENLILINNHTYTKHQSCLQIHWAELQKNVISLPYINSNEFVLMEIVNLIP